MFDRLRTWLLRVLRVPPEPEPPFGASGTVRVFRAARNYYNLRLIGWGLAQVGALFGIVISLYFFNRLERGFHEITNEVESTVTNEVSQAVSTTKPIAPSELSSDTSREKGSASSAAKKKRAREALARWGWLPKRAFSVLSFLEFVGLGVFAFQALATYAALRLDYELRWYIVTDRSLRIRSGIWNVQELTMSFANLQQVVLSQGPVQRLLGIADVKVQSAGGGGGSSDDHHHRDPDSMHTGVFHGVDNAGEVRDLILHRLQHFRDTGLGDPDERPPSSAPEEFTPALNRDSGLETLLAARELLTEARNLRTGFVNRSKRSQD